MMISGSTESHRTSHVEESLPVSSLMTSSESITQRISFSSIEIIKHGISTATSHSFPY